MSEVSLSLNQSLCLSAVFIFNTTIKSQTILNCHMYVTHSPVELAPTEECYAAGGASSTDISFRLAMPIRK